MAESSLSRSNISFLLNGKTLFVLGVLSSKSILKYISVVQKSILSTVAPANRNTIANAAPFT